MRAIRKAEPLQPGQIRTPSPKEFALILQDERPERTE